MTDIRTTAILSTFAGGDETPLREGGNWGPAYTSPQDELNLISHAAVGGSVVGYKYWTSAWQPNTFSGDVQVWALLDKHADALDYYVQALWSNTGGNPNLITGYQFEIEQGSPSNAIRLYRDDPGSSTLLYSASPGPIPVLGDYVLLQTIGTEVEVWYSHDNGANWTLLANATDTTYRTDFKLVIGTFSGLDAPGWSNFGGGSPSTSLYPQIYRRVYNA